MTQATHSPQPLPAGYLTAAAPATLLERMAHTLPVFTCPVRINTNEDRAALAAEALWLFAQRTGLAQDGESIETVLIDFMADVMHLCEQTALNPAEGDVLGDITRHAALHYEMDLSEQGEG
ncbi:hypothetical protein [Siccibacter turicensis]|uniref:hypothetical protein n=1 Tax=Siccibacter turicensis TaxID=357233 RepID=UPI003F5605E9